MNQRDQAHLLLIGALALAAVIAAGSSMFRARHAQATGAVGEIVAGYDPGAGGDITWTGRFGPGYGCPWGDMHSVLTTRHPIHQTSAIPRPDITRLIALGWAAFIASPPSTPETELD